MSDLPKYQRLPGADAEDIPLGSASTAGQRAPVVTYSYNPPFPQMGSEEHAVGRLGATLDATIEIVQNLFPKLENVEAKRIHLTIPVRDGPAPTPAAPANGSASNTPPAAPAQQWARVNDDVWDGIQGESLTRIRVELADGPGDARRRCLIVTGIILLILCIPLGAGLTAYTFDKHS